MPISKELFYQPIPKFNTDRPLSDCVITISGIEQQEKDNLTKLCEALGACVQKSLSSKNTGQFRQNTHLICKEPIGPKFEAAKAWKVPIVYPEWVVECCVTGIRADEEKFSVENGHNALAATQLLQILDRIRTNADEAEESNTTTVAEDYRDQTGVSSGGDLSMAQSKHKCGLNDSSLSASKSESKKPRLEESDYHQQDIPKISF